MNENANENDSQLECKESLQTVTDCNISLDEAVTSLPEPVCPILLEANVSGNFLDPILNSSLDSDDSNIDSSQPRELSIKGYPKGGRPAGSPNKKNELAPYHRKVRPVEDDELLKEVFTAVYQYGVQTEGHIIACLRIPRYQWRKLINKPDSKIRDTIADAIEAYETKIKQQYAEVLDSGSKFAYQFLSDENKRINRKYGESDFIIQAAPSVYESMSVEDLEKLALQHVDK